MMAGYTALAFVAVLFVPRGAGEADTGPDSARTAGRSSHAELSARTWTDWASRYRS